MNFVQEFKKGLRDYEKLKEKDSKISDAEYLINQSFGYACLLLGIHLYLKSFSPNPQLTEDEIKIALFVLLPSLTGNPGKYLLKYPYTITKTLRSGFRGLKSYLKQIQELKQKRKEAKQNER